MECRKYQELISAELDGEITPEESAALRAHLEQCETCRRYREALQALSRLTQTEEAVPEGFAAFVMGALPERIPRRRQFRRWAGLAAALVLVAGLTWLTGRGLRSGAAATADKQNYSVAVQEMPDTDESAAWPETAQAPLMAAPAEAGEGSSGGLSDDFTGSSDGTELSREQARIGAAARDYIKASLADREAELEDPSAPLVEELPEGAEPEYEPCRSGYSPKGARYEVRFATVDGRELVLLVDEDGVVYGVGRES